MYPATHPPLSRLVNGVERLADPVRRPVTLAALNGPFLAAHPNWDPAGIDLSPAALAAQHVEQGPTGNCWFLAAFLALSRSRPRDAAALFSEVPGRGNLPAWEVRLHLPLPGPRRRLRPHTIRVGADELPLRGALTRYQNSDGSLSSAAPGGVSIAEAALLKAFRGRPSAIWADTPAGGLSLLTGKRVRDRKTPRLPVSEDFAAALRAGAAITVMTNPLFTLPGSALVPAHVYAVERASGGDVGLLNPHGPAARSRYRPSFDPQTASGRWHVWLAAAA
ncbi:hypothetical protein KRX56_07650 [Dermabacteraceae bacterium TAE3-ERU27]|nr:hypothetical protein [Dermabacteraceae bacterium TAE3-ERU27]